MLLPFTTKTTDYQLEHPKSSIVTQSGSNGVFCLFQKLNVKGRESYENTNNILNCIVWLYSHKSLPPRIYGQDEDINNSKQSGRIIRSYREKQSSKDSQIQHPDWVEKALRLSIPQIQRQSSNSFLNVENSFVLQSAEQDDLGQIHLRLNQVKNQVSVFGGQLTAHVDTQGKVRILGRFFKEAETLETSPLLDETEAIRRAKDALGYTGDFAKAPGARLVILPEWIIDQRKNTSKVILTYLVELLILDGTRNTARHFYFIDAQKGEIIWHYDNLQTQLSVGTGYTLYSGTVNFYTFRVFTLYYLQDNTKCPGCLPNPGFNPSYTMTMNNQTNPNNGQFFANPTNIWGNGTTSHPETVGADAHFGMSKTWDYLYNVHGRYGIDGNGFPLKMRVHYDVNYNNAFWDSVAAHFGDGDGTTASPLVSIDTVAHEITHGLTEKTANLIYSNESGGSNESFSDIFGTAVEFYTGINPDYTIGEDWLTPSTPNDALRYMYNPPLDGVSIDHYSQYVPGMDVHFSSGIQSKAFYLLATDRSRNIAERIFYRALTVYLFPSATFHDVRVATLNAAADLYGVGSKPYEATAWAWDVVGVF
jgi:thermolysin